MGADTLEERIRRLPDRPGVYLFRDRHQRILYIGKAKSLRARVRSYFGTGPRSARQRELVSRIAGVETFVVDSEAEALLLEANLIREHRPRFNIQLRDDKSFPYVKVTVQEPFPRVVVTRKLERDGARYFGPFTNVGAMRRALRVILGEYRIRSCHYDLPRSAPPRPCLDYHIERCRAPCIGLQTETEYRQAIDRVLAVLNGRSGMLRRSLRERMSRAARELDYERAAEYRDALAGLEVLGRRQTSVDFRGGDRDVLGLACQGPRACCLFLKIRDGRLLGSEAHYLHNVEGEELAGLTEAAIKACYLDRDDLPPELCVATDFADRQLIEAYLTGRRGRRFRVNVGRRGRLRRLLALADRNAEHLLKAREEAPGEEPEMEGIGAAPGSVHLAAALGLATLPRDVVCFDVSTLAGRESVGSLVWLHDGRPWKQEYRRFRIRETEEGSPDDYAMMLEIVSRYFHRRVRDDAPLPDLVLVDGGKGQLGAAMQAMESAGVSDLAVAALAKRAEELFLPGRPEPVRLDRSDPALHWLQRARDEAHRFAVGYHRRLRRKRTLTSRLSEIPGVGPAREKELLRRFGSVKGVRRASVEELRRVPGIGPATARRILAALGAPEGEVRRKEKTTP